MAESPFDYCDTLFIPEDSEADREQGWAIIAANEKARGRWTICCPSRRSSGVQIPVGQWTYGWPYPRPAVCCEINADDPQAWGGGAQAARRSPGHSAARRASSPWPYKGDDQQPRAIRSDRA